MTVTYRDATPDDAEALSALGRRTFVATFGYLYAPDDLDAYLVKHEPERWAELIEAPDVAVRVAVDVDQLVGYCRVSPMSLPYGPEGGAVELSQLYLLDAWKGGGHADALLDWALDAARAMGAGEIYLSVFTDNPRARRFYARRGFTEVGPYKFMVGNHADDELILKLDLA